MPPSAQSIRRRLMRRGQRRAIRKHRTRHPTRFRQLVRPRRARTRPNSNLPPRQWPRRHSSLGRQRRQHNDPYHRSRRPHSSRHPRKRQGQLRRSLRHLRSKRRLLRNHRPSRQVQAWRRSKNLCAKQPVLPCGRIISGRHPPILWVHRTALIVRNRGPRARQAIAATFRPVRAPTDRSAHPIAPISPSTAGGESAKNLPESGWRRSSGNNPSAAAGVEMRKRATWTALPRDVGSLTRTMM